jgi:DNA-binding response OmpR family regulator
MTEHRENEGRILVASENVVQAHVVRSALEQAGYDVLLAASGDEAIDLLTADTDLPDLALVDADIPGISAYEVIGTLRYLDRRDEVPVILRAAALDESMRVACLAAGVDAWLPIPAEQGELLETVQRLLPQVTREERRIAV